jgi:3-hydroxybutyryl-CoA dehydrogenase
VTVVGIVGAGTMGAGIAQVVLATGDEVVMHDVDPAAIDLARQRIRSGLERTAPAPDPDAIFAILARLRVATTLDAVAAEAEIVIEAAIEDLALKRSIIRTVDGEARPDVILATNTSALSVADIAAAATRPGRVLGLHFFNPVPRMQLVEVVRHGSVDDGVVRRAMALVSAWGKVPVVCQDTPGFIVNRVNRPYTIAALRLLEAGEGDIASIDAALRDAGFPMGPFELMDLIGIDVNLAAATAVWEGLGRPERLRPSSIQVQLVEAGHLGRKAGEGFYRYEDGRSVGPAVDIDAAGEPGGGSRDVAAAIIAAVDAEAHLARDEGVAEPAQIDLAMRLGAGHPIGPFERASTSGSTD